MKGKPRNHIQRTDSAGKHGLVVDIALHPSHEMLNVLRSGHFRGSFVVFGILPKVFKPATFGMFFIWQERTGCNSLVGRFHLRAGLGGTEFCNRAIEEVDLIVKVDDCA